jgi:hypothetical protein
LLTIEKEIDLVIDLVSANRALLQNKDIRSLYGEALAEDSWQGILAVKGEDFVIAQMSGEWWDGEYSASTETSRSDDYDDDNVDATSFGDILTWQAISRFIEDGYFIVRYEAEGEKTRRFKVASGRATEV